MQLDHEQRWLENITHPHKHFLKYSSFFFSSPHWAGGDAPRVNACVGVLLRSFNEQHYNLLPCSAISSCWQTRIALKIVLLLDGSENKQTNKTKQGFKCQVHNQRRYKVQPHKNAWFDDGRSWKVDKRVLGEPPQRESCFSKWPCLHGLNHSSTTLRYDGRITVRSAHHWLLSWCTFPGALK